MPPAPASPPPAPMAALTPFAATVAPASAMRAISTGAPTVNRSPLAVTPPLLAAQITGRYRAGMHRAIDSVTPFFVRLRRSAAVSASTAQTAVGVSTAQAVGTSTTQAAAPMETEASAFEGQSVSRATQAAPMASVSRSFAPRASAGAVWMARAAESSAPTVSPAAFAPVSRSFLIGATAAPASSTPPLLRGGALPLISRSIGNGSESVNRAAVPFAALSIATSPSTSRSILRNALPPTASGGVSMLQTRASASAAASGLAARSTSFPVPTLARFANAFAPVAASPASSISPVGTVSRRAEARRDAGSAPAASTTSPASSTQQPTAARAALSPMVGATLVSQAAPFFPSISAQTPFAARVSNRDISTPVQTTTFPSTMAARSVARAREPFAPILSAARFIAPVAARNATVGASVTPTIARTATPDVPAPGRPSVPQALWRQAAPDAPLPVERGSGVDYTVSSPARAVDFAPVQNTFTARTAPIEAHRSPLAPSFVARRGDSASPATPASSTVIFRAADGETINAPSGSETTAPETEMRTLTPFVTRSAAPFVSSAATMARAIALPAASAFLSMTTATAFSQPPGISQTGAVARRAALSIPAALIAPVPTVSRAARIDRAPFASPPLAILPHFAPTISRLAMSGEVSRAPQSMVNRQAAFVPAAAAQTVSIGPSFPTVAARAAAPFLFVPPALSRSTDAMAETAEVNAPNTAQAFVQTANQTAPENAAPGFVARQFSPSVAANGAATAFLSPIAARTVAPMGSVSRMPIVSQTASGAFSSLGGPQSFLARQAVLPAPIALRSSTPIAAPTFRTFGGVTAFRAANDTSDESTPEPTGAPVLRDFQIARVFAAPAFPSVIGGPSSTDASTTTPGRDSSTVASAASVNAFSAPGTAFLARHIAPQTGETGPRVTRAALPFTTLVSRALLTTAPFILRVAESSMAARNGNVAPALTSTSTAHGSEAEASPFAALRFSVARESLPAVETDSETDAPAMSLAGVPSAARSAAIPAIPAPPSFAAPPLPVFRAPLSSALSFLPSAPFATHAARQNSEAPSELSEGMGTVVPRFVARLTAIAPFAPPISALVNRSAPSVNVGNNIYRSAGETGETPSVSQLFSTRGAAHEIARTLRDGTLTTASLARQSTEPVFAVQRAVEGGEAPGGAPAPEAGGGAAGGAGGGAPATDLMAVDRQVDLLWDRFMQRLRIEQERAGFH